ETRKLTEYYTIKHIPTLLIVKSDGTEIDRIINISGDKEYFLQFIKETGNGIGAFAKLRAAHEKDPADLEITYKLFKKYIQRGELEGVVRTGKKILERADSAKTIKIVKSESSSHTNIYDDTQYSIRTILNRSGRADLLKYFHEFPGIKFSLSVYKFLAGIYSTGPQSEKAGLFFERAMNDYPGSFELGKQFVDYCLATKSRIDWGINIASNLYESIEKTGYRAARLKAAVLALRGDVLQALSVYGPGFIEQFSNDTEAHHDYARFWVLQNVNFQSALASARLAVGRMQKHEYWFTLGLVYSKLENYNESVKAFEQAVHLSNGEIPAYNEQLLRIKLNLSK
ncbi:hypothetical protein AMJ80_10640, partial [bacterium SM23_31]